MEDHGIVGELVSGYVCTNRQELGHGRPLSNELQVRMDWFAFYHISRAAERSSLACSHASKNAVFCQTVPISLSRDATLSVQTMTYDTGIAQKPE